MDINEFLQAVEAATEQNQGCDYLVPSRDLSAEDGKSIGILWQGTKIRLQPTDHAVGQLFGRLGRGVPNYGNRSLPRPYLNAIPAALWKQNVQSAIDGMPQDSRPWLVRGNTYGKMRAVFTNRYIPFDGRHLAGLAAEAAESIKGTTGLLPILRNVHVGSDYTGVDLMFPGSEVAFNDVGSTFQIGISIGTEETGRGTLHMNAALYRTQCRNSYQVIDRGVSLKKFFSHQTIRSLFVDTFRGLRTAAGQAIRVLNIAESFPIHDIAEVMKGFCVVNGYTESDWQASLMGTEGKSTMAGLVHGISHGSKTAADPVIAMKMQKDAISALFRVETSGAYSRRSSSDGEEGHLAQHAFVEGDADLWQTRVARWRSAAKRDFATVEQSAEEDRE